ncbi:tetratricopeptide repeat protein [Thermanaerothrix sp. 4228-RoL]|uniref:Tetratricopeptide repeat protein n=1 Tax=Thermanaerothrix solaris TaxID=3058434 RepID=A0ABU3NLC1_9CHLR|nr:tetratricopeptide repeat protein [Thermanaerothrix sp. 4228-RoL]MDT8897641.1 tetratricopeptide repeat protein [Thermanaerothrix sp. 4228-RoL]
MSEVALVDTWLSQAEEALQAENWPEALEALQKVQTIDPDNPAILSILGTCFLHLGMIEEARETLETLVQRQPDSAEAYNNLGVALLMDNDPHNARLAFEKALALESTNKVAQKHLALACLQCQDFSHAAQILENLITTSDEVELRLWLGHCYAGLGRPNLARELYHQVLQRQPDHPQAQDALHALDRIAQPEQPKPQIARTTTPIFRTILFCGSGEVSDFRLHLPARWLKQVGYHTRFILYPQPKDIESADVVIFLRPHIRRESMQALAECVRKGKTIIVDIDDDFHNIPVHHPGYYHCGPGNPNILRALELAIGAAAVLVVSTPTLAERYGHLAHRVQVIPNGWDDENPNWEQPAPPHTGINVGWAGTATHREDILLVRNELLHFLRSYPEVKLFIGGDPQIFELFKPLPERQKVFLPFRLPNEYPLMLANFDILLAPLANNRFNQAKSDIKLVEAGARRLPWVASPLPAYQTWGVGGIFAETPSSWGDALSTLVRDSQLRQQLGAAGRKKSEARNREVISLWSNLLGTL